jgi:hypothetical protein
MTFSTSEQIVWNWPEKASTASGERALIASMVFIGTLLRGESG